MIKDKDHRDYTNFVSEVFQCIEVLLPGQQNPLTAILYSHAGQMGMVYAGHGHAAQ